MKLSAVLFNCGDDVLRNTKSLSTFSRQNCGFLLFGFHKQTVERVKLYFVYIESRKGFCDIKLLIAILRLNVKFQSLILTSRVGILFDLEKQISKISHKRATSKGDKRQRLNKIRI